MESIHQNGKTYIDRDELYDLLLERQGTAQAAKDRDEFKRGYAQALEWVRHIIYPRSETRRS